MEWNSKSPGQWDWEEHLFFNGKASENPKLQSITDWSAEADQEINVGLFYPLRSSRCSESELMHASSSRSSKSASINSSSNEDSKLSMFTLEGSQDDDSSRKKELSKEEPVEIYPAPEPSSGSGEPLLILKLGKRLYFEDVCTGSDSMKPSSITGKKCKSNGRNLQHPSCQVEGCGLDLSSAKGYHRKHRVCENHSKSPKVVIAGSECRFCQQCSRFHGLSEFDDKKRSCRQRLLDHNARRRKPHLDEVRLHTSALSSSPYGTEDPITSSNLNATQDVNHALSLLSNNSSYETKSFSITTHAMSHHHLPFASSEYWNTHQQPPNSRMCVTADSDCDNSNRFQDFQSWNTL
ncbi:PREDICTED: squamosa promoter-binding-like protein 3 isoform X2 [Lupinus angustifolius]|uniref:squamosa promoter-binding-like protein 3 isoform X2 n=1 Tax=Lupinus angustifolius TaxID=3871 RepID=UPI00092FB0E4|nr:PREDICTED: squamosa promoter-binding-like protein 3 isoform X2 [Lupinus angustifolius]